jgi:hypothetical protein
VILDIKVTLDSGGTVTIHGDDLTAEGVNEVFAILGGYNVEAVTQPEDIDLPLPGPITDDMKEAFVDGFDEGRTENKE